MTTNYLSVNDVRDLGAEVSVAGYGDGIGIGNGRYFIPSFIQPSGAWGFREVSRRRFYCWVFINSAFRNIIPGDIALALQTRNVAAIIP